VPFHSRALVTVVSCVLAVTCLASIAPTASGASTALSTNGVWPGVGKICGSGPGGDTTATRGVSTKSVNLALFNDANNTVEPGLDIEFVQMAQAFATWCNASGGIDGRKIAIDNRDAGFFNAAQVTSQACRSDFMAVGGGMVLDGPAVPVREACGLGQIPAITVSNASQTASLQVSPGGISNDVWTAGYFRTLAKLYPSAVKKAGFGAQNDQDILEPELKWRFAAQKLGWKTVSWQEPPLSVVDWTPYVQQAQDRGVEALWPPDAQNIAPYVQAMNTLGYNPTFMILGTQFYDAATIDAAAQHKFPKTYVELQTWPLEMASANPSTEQMVKVLHTYGRGDPVDFNDQESINALLLWAKAATSCGTALSVSCVLQDAAAQRNWDAGGIAAPVARLGLSTNNPGPSPCFVLLQVRPHKFVYDKAATMPTQSIWNCDPSNLVHLSTSDLKQIAAQS
jgi:ABC-type branched-subunit amino acid transport system substrate-binding protein